MKKNIFLIMGVIVMTLILTSACSSTKVVDTKATSRIESVVTKDTPLGKWYKCNTCNGKGRCTTCKGTGKIGNKQCGSCNGTGHCFACNGEGGFRRD